MLEAARKYIGALPTVPAHWLLSAGTIASFGWLLLEDRVHPIFIYVLQIYLTF